MLLSPETARIETISRRQLFRVDGNSSILTVATFTARAQDQKYEVQEVGSRMLQDACSATILCARKAEWLSVDGSRTAATSELPILSKYFYMVKRTASRGPLRLYSPARQQRPDIATIFADNVAS